MSSHHDTVTTVTWTCDRCGEVWQSVQGDEKNYSAHHNPPWAEIRTVNLRDMLRRGWRYDLCHNCVRLFDKFMGDAKGEST